MLHWLQVFMPAGLENFTSESAEAQREGTAKYLFAFLKFLTQNYQVFLFPRIMSGNAIEQDRKYSQLVLEFLGVRSRN
jgi:hypothetical protein